VRFGLMMAYHTLLSWVVLYHHLGRLFGNCKWVARAGVVCLADGSPTFQPAPT